MPLPLPNLNVGVGVGSMGEGGGPQMNKFEEVAGGRGGRGGGSVLVHRTRSLRNFGTTF